MKRFCGANARILLMVLLTGVMVPATVRVASAQTAPQDPAHPLSAPGTPDPLQVGRAALIRKDFPDAQSFFTQYLKDDPNNPEALLGEGNAELGLKNYSAAKARYEQALAVKPNLWAAHENLLIVYASLNDWKAFDAERTSLAASRAAHAPGLPENMSMVIDAFDVDGKRYIVREFDPPIGHFHVKYSFVHFGADNKPESWISCESDDVDQISYAKAHPKEAAAGQRSYSLDSYSAITTLANGQKTQTHGTIKFYPEGEPSYETVRADVMHVLQGKTGPVSSSTTTKP